MPIEVRFTFNTVEDAKGFIGSIGKKGKEILAGSGVNLGVVETAPPEPVNLGVVETALAAPQSGAPTEAPGNNISQLLGGGEAVAPAPPALTPVAAVPEAPAVQQPPPPPPVPEEPPNAPSQSDLISAFTQLGNVKDRDAIAGILKELGVSTVVEIPEAHYGAVIARINSVLSS